MARANTPSQSTVRQERNGSYTALLARPDGELRPIEGFRSEHEAAAFIVQSERALLTWVGQGR
jgi:hypothetical protein